MKTKRTRERLIQLARSVNDNVVGEHIGQLCRDMADELEMMGDAVAGAMVISNEAGTILRGKTSEPPAAIADDAGYGQ